MPFPHLMQELMLVGGIPYSGKSYLCKSLVERNPNNCIYLGLDNLHEKMDADPMLFFRSLALFYPQIIRQIGMDPNSLSKSNLQERKVFLEELFTKHAGRQSWISVVQQAVNAYIVSQLKLAGSKVPIIESLLHDLERRSMFFESYADMIDVMHAGIDLVAAKKTLVYLDLGIEVSLQRFRDDPSKRPLVNERVILYTYQTQQIPASHEFPNLEVIVLRNKEQVREFIEGTKLSPIST